MYDKPRAVITVSNAGIITWQGKFIHSSMIGSIEVGSASLYLVSNENNLASTYKSVRKYHDTFRAGQKI